MEAENYYALCDPKEWIVERITASRMLCKGPCYLSYVHSDPTASGSAMAVDVYDGENDSGDLKFTINNVNVHPPLSLPRPAYFRRGLYIKLTSNAASVSVQYMPMRD